MQTNHFQILTFRRFYLKDILVQTKLCKEELKEQIAMKYFIPINESEYILSNKGKRFVKLSKLFVNFFSIDKKFTNPKQVNF